MADTPLRPDSVRANPEPASVDSFRHNAIPNPVYDAIRAEGFEVNGCKTVSLIESEEYFECAHAVLIAAQMVTDTPEGDRPNSDVQSSLMRTAILLVEHGMWRSSHERVQDARRRAGEL